MVLNSGARTLAHHSVSVSVHPPPPPSALAALPPTRKVRYFTDVELMDQASEAILKDLKAELEKDIVERFIAPEVRRMVVEDKQQKKARGRVLQRYNEKSC